MPKADVHIITRVIVSIIPVGFPNYAARSACHVLFKAMAMSKLESK